MIDDPATKYGRTDFGKIIEAEQYSQIMDRLSTPACPVLTGKARFTAGNSGTASGSAVYEVLALLDRQF